MKACGTIALLLVLLRSTICFASHEGDLILQETHQQTDLIQTHNFEIIVTDFKADPVPCRIHLKDADENPIEPPGYPFNQTHFICDGRAALDLKPGIYSYEIERGHEWGRKQGTFEVTDQPKQKLHEVILRYVDLADEGWFCADLHIHRPLEQLEPLMLAEDLFIAPAITWWNGTNHWSDHPLPKPPTTCFDANRCYNIMAGEDEHGGGALMFFNCPKPIDITWAQHEYPGPMYFAEIVKSKYPDSWIDIEKPFWWDVPVFLAHGVGDSIGIANNHIWRNGMLDNEAWGKPRDREKFPSPHGCALWSQEVYFQILNAGFRIPPSAGSASGVMPNSIGYNRVYVYLGEQPMNWDNWWQGLKQGKCFVTNGPLMRMTASGQLPGHVFQSDQPLEIEIAGRIDALDKITRVEIIQNGKVVKTIPCGHIPVTETVKFKSRGPWGKVTFDRSGWLAVRTFADVEHTCRFAMTAPWYVQIGEEKISISRSACRFFLDWTNQRIAYLEKEDKDLKDPEKRAAVLKYHYTARDFWTTRLNLSNAR